MWRRIVWQILLIFWRSAFLLGVFYSEYGVKTFLRNTGKHLPNCVLSHSKRQHFFVVTTVRTSHLALIPLLTHNRRKAIPLNSSAGEEKRLKPLYMTSHTKIRFILNAWMQHEMSTYEQVTKATLGITLIKTKNVGDGQHQGRERKISLNNFLEQCFSFVFILLFLLFSILESYLNFNYPTNPNSEGVVSLVSSCSIIVLFLFLSRPLLWSVGPTPLNAETRSCSGNVDGHPSYTRFIFLRATKKKEVGGKEMDERTRTQKGRNLSRDLERTGMKEKLRVLCSLSSERGEKTTQFHFRSHFIMKLVRCNILNFPTWTTWPWLESLTIASL